MKGKSGHGRGNVGKRGLGSGKGSHKSSTAKPASISGYKKTQGDGRSGKSSAGNAKY